MKPFLFKCLFPQADDKTGGGPPDILSEPAMHNAYFICHNVQVGNLCIFLCSFVLLRIWCISEDSFGRERLKERGKGKRKSADKSSISLYCFPPIKLQSFESLASLKSYKVDTKKLVYCNNKNGINIYEKRIIYIIYLIYFVT